MCANFGVCVCHSRSPNHELKLMNVVSSGRFKSILERVICFGLSITTLIPPLNQLVFHDVFAVYGLLGRFVEDNDFCF